MNSNSTFTLLSFGSISIKIKLFIIVIFYTLTSSIKLLFHMNYFQLVIFSLFACILEVYLVVLVKIAIILTAVKCTKTRN